MLQFSLWNIHQEDPSDKRREEIINGLLSKRKDLWFIDVDTLVDTESIKNFVSKVGWDFDNIVVFGMWWSALGAKALIEATHGKYYNEVKNKKWKNIYVLDNIDSHTIDDVEKLIDIERTLFCFISKSGTTIEPISQYLYFRNLCQKKCDDWKKNFCFVVWENCSMRADLEKEFPVFLIPETTWWRFSVFTPVGLLPLAFSGVDINEYLTGISESREDFLSEDLTKNIPFQLALMQSNLYNKQGIDCSVLFSYSSRLFQFGEWYKQLLAESIGKDGQGITPISSIWASDQHSELQLYQDGPKNKLFTFIDVENPGVSPVPDQSYPDLSFNNLLDIYQFGTESSLKNEDHPVCKLTLLDLSEKTLGSLLYMYMFQIAYLWELMWINAFDQPWVEKSKSFARQKTKQDFGDIDLFQKAFGG